MRALGVSVKVVGLALCLLVVWFLSGYQESAFRSMGF